MATQRFAKYFSNQGHGNILNIASIYGVIPPRFSIYKNLSITSPIEYAAIKSGLIHISKYFTKYYKGKNLRFNTISPGGIFDGHDEDFSKNYSAFCLNKGLLDPNDICGTVSFLLSNESQFINGQNIIIDDGFTL
jgi:NAD(P)-dependent dehydrogenase (short-subunit alcohol dehydrogenase family)